MPASRIYTENNGQYLEAYLDKCIHSHYRHIRLWFSVIHQIQIHEFLQLQVIGLHTIHYIRKQRRHILANRHRSYDLESITYRGILLLINEKVYGYYLLHSLFFLLFLVTVQFRLQLEYFTFFGGRKVFGIRHLDTKCDLRIEITV